MLVDDLEAKIAEQLERTVHLIGLLPSGQVQWKPALPNAWSAGEVLGHILDCTAGLCAVLYAANPEALAHFAALRDLPVNQACGPAEACDRIGMYHRHIGEGFALLDDSDLGRLLPTVFVTAGESLLTLLLGNLEHLINHKHQLFTYLKLMGVSGGTPDLYHFRSEPPYVV
jgi:hypothetical protein